MRLRPRTRLRAARLGRYPSAATAWCTRWRTSALTCGSPLITRDTVFWETPAARATSIATTGRVFGATALSVMRVPPFRPRCRMTT